MVAATSSGKRSSGQAASSGGSGGKEQQATVAIATHGGGSGGGGGKVASLSGSGGAGASDMGGARGFSAAENKSGSEMTASAPSAAALLWRLPWWSLASQRGRHRRAGVAFKGAEQRTAAASPPASEQARVAFDRPCAK